MLNDNQEIQDAPAEQGNKLRMALVEPMTDIGTVDCPASTVENNEKNLIKWWAMAVPILVIIGIIVVHYLQSPVDVMADSENSSSDSPVLPAASTSPKPAPSRSSKKGFVSGIAYSEDNAIAFVNGKMVSEGSVVDGLTVVKINQTTVEFERKGKRWTQKVGE